MSRLQVRMRPDLIVERSAPGEAWVVQDPLSLRYFHLRDEECALLRLLDGRRTLEELRQRFETLFAPLTLSAAQLQAFLHRLHALGLVIADAPGQGAVLARRAEEFQRRTFWMGLANPLAIRLPGVPAAAWIARLYRNFGWLLSPLMLLLWAGLVFGAALLLSLHWAEFWRQMPSAESFLAVEQGFWFLVVLVGVKCLHELGHALTLAHFGGKVHAVGVMLLVFSPVIYCDVSDAWRLHPAWKRVVVSAAGMLVELVIAALAALVWRYSEPGLVQSLALRVLIVCTLSTLLFNANPLIRGDGYYILSDFVQVPNLGQESRSALGQLAGEWLLGWPAENDPLISPWKRLALASYGAASILYGWMLLAAVLWFCAAALQPYGLADLAKVLAVVVVAGAAAPGLLATAAILKRPSGWPKMRRGRAALSLTAAAALLLAACLIPLPFEVAAPVWLEPAEPHNLYVTTPGLLQLQTPPGARVRRGAVIAVLENPQLEDERRALEAEVRLHELRLKHLRLLLAGDPTVGPRIPAEEKTLEDLRRQLAQAEEEQNRLTLRAERDGVVIEPPALPGEQHDGSLSRLPTWEGTPLEPRNLGCLLEAGTLVCQIADPERIEAHALIDQADLPWVRKGQQVRIWVEQGPVRVLTGTIIDLARTDADALPQPLLAALRIPPRDERRTGVARDEMGVGTVFYQARIALDPSPKTPQRVGMLGQVKISAQPQTLGARIWRAISRTFRLG